MVLYYISQLIMLYTWVLVAFALMSWMPSLYNTAVGRFIIKITRPYLSLFDKLPLRFWGLDFSVILAVIVLQVLREILFRIV